MYVCHVACWLGGGGSGGAKLLSGCKIPHCKCGFCLCDIIMMSSLADSHPLAKLNILRATRLATAVEQHEYTVITGEQPNPCHTLAYLVRMPSAGHSALDETTRLQTQLAMAGRGADSGLDLSYHPCCLVLLFVLLMDIWSHK